MAFSVKASDLPETGELHASKVVIVTGPSFGTGLKLILFGAVLGAGAALYWKNQQESKSPPPAVPDKSSEALATRLRKLAERLRDLAAHTAEVAAPALQNALQEAKKAARAAESQIEEEIREMREQDGKPEQV